MSQEKQIEELRGVLWLNPYVRLGSHNAHMLAQYLHNEDYRKQSEGEWKLGKSGCMYFCSECNYAAHPREVDEWSYCPRCGAKMKERIAHEQERNAPGE